MTNEVNSIVETILDEETVIKTIAVEKPPIKWYLRVFKRNYTIENTYTIKVTPAKLSVMAKISGYMNRISEILESRRQLSEMAEEIAPILARILATASINDRGKAPEWLVTAILDQFSVSELKQAIEIVYRRLDYSTFFACTELLAPMNLIDTQEIEAYGQQSEESSNITD